MKIILAGIEYVGTTTLANLLLEWKERTTGEPFYMGLIHDHSKIPHTSGHPDNTTLEEQQQILNLSPKLKEMYHRYSMYYHVHHYVQEDDLTVGLHIEESILARMYYGYGGPGEEFDREIVFEQIERRIKQVTSDPIIIVHMTASPEVIEQRMSELSGTLAHSNSPMKIEDIPEVMSEYSRLVQKASIGPVIHIDTSIDTPQKSLNRLVKLMEPYFTESDRNKINGP